MKKDKLFLLSPGFEDTAYPGQLFYCGHCALLEGALASFPTLVRRLDVARIAWPRLRLLIVELLGAENQPLPLLVLGGGKTSSYQCENYHGRAFMNEKDKILAALSERHGFPAPHP